MSDATNNRFYRTKADEIDPGNVVQRQIDEVVDAVWSAAHPRTPPPTRLREHICESHDVDTVRMRRVVMAILAEVCAYSRKDIGAALNRNVTTVADSLAAYEDKVAVARTLVTANSTYADWARALMEGCEMPEKAVTLENVSTGSVVQLRSGGPDMTVRSTSVDTVYAGWFRADGKYDTASFHPEMLVHSKPF